jgi:hypothetical protein
MITSIEPKTGSWILLVGPRSLNSTVLEAIAKLGSIGPVRVLDGGNRFAAYKVTRAARGQLDILNNITVARAFNCYQVLSALEDTPSIPSPFVVLDMLSTFYDESVKARERKQLLYSCIVQLKRLVRNAGGVVSIHPPAVPSQTATELLKVVQDYTFDSYYVVPKPSPYKPMRLF